MKKLLSRQQQNHLTTMGSPENKQNQTERRLQTLQNFNKKIENRYLIVKQEKSTLAKNIKIRKNSKPLSLILNMDLYHNKR